MPVPSAWTGSLLEWAKAVAGLKLMPVPRSLKGRLAAWLNLSGAARSRPVPGETTHSSRMWALARAGVKVDDSAGRSRGADGRDSNDFLVRRSADRDLVTDGEALHAADNDMGGACAGIGREIGLLGLRANVRNSDSLNAMADAVDVEPDLVANRDIGNRGHLEVGRASRSVRSQIGLCARLADGGDRGHLVLLHIFRDRGIGCAIAESDLLADREAGNARDRHVGGAGGNRDHRTVGERLPERRMVGGSCSDAGDLAGLQAGAGVDADRIAGRHAGRAADVDGESPACAGTASPELERPSR